MKYVHRMRIDRERRRDGEVFKRSPVQILAEKALDELPERLKDCPNLIDVGGLRGVTLECGCKNGTHREV